MSRNRRFLRFGLRTALLGVALLCVGFAVLATYFRSPPNEVSKATLDRLVGQVKPGMTVAEISDIFGFDRDPLPRELGLDHDGNPTWTFCLTDQNRWPHGNMVFYVGEFSNGRLANGELFSPI